MKRVLCWVAAAVLCLWITLSASAAERGKLSLHSESQKLTRGDVFTVTLQCNRNPGVQVMRLSLSYDRQVLELKEIRDLGLFPGFKAEQKDGGDTLSYQEEKNKTFSLTGNVASLTFRVRDDAPFGSSRIGITYSDRTLDIRNAAGKAVPFEIQTCSFDLICLHGRVTRETVVPASLSADGTARVTCFDCGETWEEALRPEIVSEDGKIRAAVPSGIFADGSDPAITVEYCDSGDQFDAAKERFGDDLTLAFRIRFLVLGEEVVPFGDVDVTLECPEVLPEGAVLYSYEDGYPDPVDGTIDQNTVRLPWRDALILVVTPPEETEPTSAAEEPVSASELPETDDRSPEEEKRLRDAVTLAISAGALVIAGIGIALLTRRVRKKY